MINLRMNLRDEFDESTYVALDSYSSVKLATRGFARDTHLALHDRSYSETNQTRLDRPA